MNKYILSYQQIAEAVAANHESVSQRLANVSLCLLTDDEGVSEKSWFALLSLCRKVCPELAVKLSAAVEATDGRWYLPESKVQGVIN